MGDGPITFVKVGSVWVNPARVVAVRETTAGVTEGSWGTIYTDGGHSFSTEMPAVSVVRLLIAPFHLDGAGGGGGQQHGG